MDLLLELLRPYVVEILTALTAALVTLIRAWVQRRVALKATARQEETSASGPVKKIRAMAQVTSSLPPGVRPFTREGLDQLVENAVKRTSNKPDKA